MTNHNIRTTHRLWRKFIRVFLGLGILFCVAVTILFFMFDTRTNEPKVEVFIIYQPLPTPGSDLEALETNAEIKIPLSAREIHGLISGYRELDTWVRLDLPNTELPTFLVNARCIGPLHATDPQKHQPADLDPDWWQPYNAIVLEECNGLHQNLYQHILVDRSRSETLTIYVLSVAQDYSASLKLTPNP